MQCTQSFTPVYSPELPLPLVEAPEEDLRISSFHLGTSRKDVPEVPAVGALLVALCAAAAAVAESNDLERVLLPLPPEPEPPLPDGTSSVFAFSLSLNCSPVGPAQLSRKRISS